MKKRMISLLLCLCMVFSLLPTAVLAADGEDPDTSAGPGQVTQQNPEDLGDQSDSNDQSDSGDQADPDDLNDSENSDDSDAPQLLGEGLGSELFGSCGATPADTVSWALTPNDDGRTYTLTISGEGAMADYYAQYVQRKDFPGDIAPWRRALLSDVSAERTTEEVVPITKVEIGDGVTRIGSGAFAYTALTGTVTFNKNVASYGDGVFARDTSITAVNWTNFKPTEKITDGWATVYTKEHIAIPYAFFDGCSSLGTSIIGSTEYSGQLVLPDTIEAIYVAAFRGTGFSTVDFSDGLSSIQAVGSYAISKLANMTEFTYPGNVDFYGVNDEGQNNVIQGGGIEKLTIAKEVTELPVCFCTNTENLTTVEVEDGSQLTTIGADAFTDNNALKSIDISSPVTSVGDRAFYDCKALESVKIQGSSDVVYPYTTFSAWIGGGREPAPLKTLEIGAGKIQFDLSNQKDSIETIVLGDGVTEIPTSFASGCTKLTSVSLSDALKAIPDNAFSKCIALAEVTISKDSQLVTIGKSAFHNTNLTQIYIPKDVAIIEYGAFQGTPITLFDMSDVLAQSMTVGTNAINNWYSEQSKADWPAWKDDFKYIYVSNSGAAASVEEKTNCCNHAFFVTNGGSVDATKTGFAAVYRTGYTAQWYEEGGSPVTGKPVTGKTYYVQWTKGAFGGPCGATGNEENVYWTLAPNGNGYTLSIAGTGAMADYTCNITGSDATQPWRESMTGVAPTEITKVVVVNGVTNIGSFACDGLSQVKEYDIAASVAKIGPWGVCSQNAETYNLTGSTHYVVTADDGVLMSADEKTLVSYPGGKDAVDEYVIPENVETILAGAFVGSDAKKVVIPNSVTNFPRFSFGGSTVEEIEFNANVKTLEGGAFSGLSKLKSLVFGGTTLTTIRDQACSDLSSLTEITFPDSLTTIEGQAFKVLPEDGAAAPNLKKVTFGKGMSTIGSVVFLRQSALEVIDMTHCAEPTLKAVGEFNSHNYDDNETHPYTTTPIVYTADEGVAELVQQNNRNLIYAVTNGGTFPADTEFEAGKLAEPKKEGCLFLGWYKSADFSGEKVTTFEAGQTYYAKWMENIPEPTNADLAKGEVAVKCLTPTCSMRGTKYGLNQAVVFGDPKPALTKIDETHYTVTYDADAFASKAADKRHSLYSADTLTWKLTYDGSKWNLEPKTSGVDDVVLVTHAPTTFDEVTKFIDGRTDVIKTSCVNGETATCAYGLMVAFVNPDHVVSVEQEKDSSGEPIRGSYIATLKMDQFAEACAKACNSKSFASSPRTHDVLSKNPVQWRFQVRQAEVSTDAGTEKPYVWSAEPVEAGKDDVCQVAHNWVVTFNPDNGEPAFTQDVKYDGKAAAPDAPEKEGCEFTGWYLDEAEEPFSFDTTITSDITLTAHWTIVTVDVSFDPNGGNELAEADKTKVVKIGEAYGDLPVPTRTGYDFLGWFTAAEEGDQVTANTVVTATTDHTLYARWQQKTYKVVAKLYVNGQPAYRLNTDFYTYEVSGLYGEDINFDTIKADAVAQAKQIKKASASYTAVILEDHEPNAVCTTFGEHQPNQTTHYVKVNVKTEEKVMIFQSFEGKTDLTTLRTVTAPYGTNVVDFLNDLGLDLAVAGYTLDTDEDGNANWYKKDSPTWTFGEADTINGWTNVLLKYTITPHNIYAYLRTADSIGDVLELNETTLNRLGLTKYNTEGFISIGTFVSNTLLTQDEYYGFDEDQAFLDVLTELQTKLMPETGVSLDKVGGKINWSWLYQPSNVDDRIAGYPTEDTDGYQLSGSLLLYGAKFEAGADDVTGMPTTAYGAYLDYFVSGESFTLPAAPTRPGYDFKGWKIGNTTLEAGASYTVDENDMIFTAQWKLNTYTVIGKLYLNGKPVMKADGTSQYLSTPLTGLYGEAINYTSMEAWAKELVLNDIDHANAPVSATVKIYKDGGTLDPSATFGNPDVSINYVWVDVTTYYEVVFNTGVEGLTVDTQTVKYGDKIEKPEDPTREGYKFLGWFEEGVAEAFNFNTEITKDTTLTAKWAANTYTVTFNPNADDATVAPTSKLVTFDAAYGELPTPTRENYRFVGWYLNGVRVTKDTIVKTAANHTLLAGWSRSYHALTINYVDKNGNPVADSYEASVALGADFSVTSPDVKGYKLRDKDDAVIEGTMTAAGYTYDVVYVKKSSGGSGVQIESPNKPEKDNSLKFNTAEHFAYVNGYPDGTVKPEGNVTRAEVAAILYRVMDADCVKTYETTRCSFSDVVRGDWFNTYVATLENAGVIVDTRTNGKFRPNEAITRAELAAMLAQFADIKSAANSFNDVSARHWASDEIAVCAKMGWINGYPDGSFRPDATITRAEMMAMINRALDRTPKSVSDLLPGMKTWSDNTNTGAWYYLDVQEATNSHTYTKSGTHETWKKLH